MNRRPERLGRKLGDRWSSFSRIAGLLVLLTVPDVTFCEATWCEDLSDTSLDAQLDLAAGLAVSLVWISAEELSNTAVGDIQFKMDARANSLGCSARQIRSLKQVAEPSMKEACSELELAVTEMTDREHERRVRLKSYSQDPGSSEDKKIPDNEWSKIWGDEGESFNHLVPAIKTISSMVLDRTSPTQGESKMSDERQRRLKGNLIAMCAPLPRCVRRCEEARASLCALNGALWPLQEKFPFDTSPDIPFVW